FPAVLQQQLLEQGLTDKGIIVCEAYDEEIIAKAFAPYDNLTLAVTLKADGTLQKQVVASIVAAVTATDHLPFLEKIFMAPSLQMVTFTITEKAYSLTDAQGAFHPWVREDMERLPECPHSLMGLIALLCYRRYQAGRLPV